MSAYQSSKIIQCIQCNQEFRVYAFKLRAGEGKYCSMRCRNQGYERPAEERFWARVKKTDKCWEWQGKLQNGYGKIQVNRQCISVHCYAYELYNGGIDNSLAVMHSCDNRRCVRPEHLSLGSLTENVKDMVRKNRQAKGEKTGNAKLVESQVIKIREMHKNGSPCGDIASLYDLHSSTIWNVVTHKTWKHLP